MPFRLFLIATLLIGGNNREEPTDPEDIFNPPTQVQKERYVENLGSGFFTSSILGNGDDARAIVVRPNGAIVLAGATNNGTDYDFAIAQYNPDGELDTSFGTTGKRTLAAGVTAGHDVIKTLILQTDGRLIAVGYGKHNNTDFLLVRYLTDGSLDTSFNTNGKSAKTVYDNGDFAATAVLETNGKTVVGGFAWWLGQYHYALLRFQTDGTLDTSFNTTGRATNKMGSSDNGIVSIAIESTGRYVVAGPVHSSDWDFGVARYKSDGSLDTSFKTDGTTVLGILSADDKNYGLAVHSDRSVFLAGYADDGSNLNAAAARLLIDGSLDTSFDTDGKKSLEITADSDGSAMTAFLQSDGKPVMAGYTYNGSNDDFAIWRFNSDGNLDTTFNTSGKNAHAMGTGQDRGQGVFSQIGNLFFLAGKTLGAVSGNLDFGVARYQTNGALGNNGAPDESFGGTPVADSGIVGTGLVVALDAGAYQSGRFGGTGCTSVGWFDLSNSFLDGTLANFTGCTTNGWNGTGVPADPYLLKFDGSDDYVEVSGTSINNLSAFTWDMWLKRGSNVRQTLFIKGGDNPSTRVLEFNVSHQLRGFIDTSSTDADSTSTNTVTNTDWHHIAMTFDFGGTKKINLYLDGAEVTYAAQVTATGALVADTTNTPRIGRRPGGAGGVFNGSIAYFSIYNTALSPSQISQNCKALEARFSSASCS